jgi:sortase A
MKKIISSILIIIGISLIVSPFINDLIIKNRVEISKEIIGEMTVEQIEKNDQQEAVYEYDDIQNVEIISTIASTMDMDKAEINENIIGQIIIDDLNINLPILKGITHSNLLIGAGTMKPDLVMGEGNYSLASHYSKNNQLFGGLLKIEKGAIVKITNKKVVYEYMIYDTQIVPDTALYMLDNNRADKRGKPILSLMTCYYTSKNGKRFFALGELVDQYPYK